MENKPKYTRAYRVGLIVAVLKELKCPIDLDRFDDRIIVRCHVALLQQLGIDFGYDFHIYARGVYSTYLIEDLFAYKDFIMKETEMFERPVYDKKSKKRMLRK